MRLFKFFISNVLCLLLVILSGFAVVPAQGQNYEVVILNGRVFDPKTISDVGTYEKPNQPAVGVQSLLVNGEVVVDGGKLVLGAAPGRPIRRAVQTR